MGYFGLPNVKPLIALLKAAELSRRKITSLKVDTLDLRFLPSEKSTLESIHKSIYDLRTIKLDFCVLDYAADDTSWPSIPNQAICRLRDFLCSAPNIETIKLTFKTQRFAPYIANSARILPVELQWPKLRKLEISGVQIHKSSFLDFLVSYG